MNNILILLGLMCLTVLSVNATPILYVRHKLGLLDMNDNNSKLKNRLIELLSCAMCIGFWVGFIFCLIFYPIITSILFAGIVAIGSELINKLLRK